jgi:hypothetical protein
LPSENARHQFDFCSYQVDAAEQLLKKLEAIKNDRRIVERALGVGSDAQWSDIVPVVLNGMPFSLPGMVNGFYYMDYASLERFFESGKLSPMKPDSSEPPDFSGIGKPVDLWASTKPAVADLKRMLQINPHFELLVRKWKPEMLTAGITKSHEFCSTVLGRGD